MASLPLASPLRLMLPLLLAAQTGIAQNNILFRENFREPLGDRWKPVVFHEPTDYQVVMESSNRCLRAFARGGCSALATKVDLPAQSGIVCTWSWKIDRCPPGGTDDSIAAFDHSAKVFIAFDTWIGPPRTINYVWANRARTNSTFEHPYSSRTKFIAVQSGNNKAGQWLTERRDLQRDWNLLFKGEPMPKIVGVGVFTDSHYTGAPVTGWYRDIVLTK